MKLPKIFKEDIQSNNVQLIPLLIIERDGFNYNQYVDDSIRKSLFISTHDITIQKGSGDSVTPGQNTDSFVPNGMHFSPLLLDSPVITEKIDIENRKYTISKCTFKISNNPYNGQRFSDMLNIDSLIGKKVNFAYKSVNSLIPMHYLQTNTAQGDGWAENYDYYTGVSPTFYYGEIRDIQHDNEKVTITAEDLGSALLHQDLPKNSLPADTSIDPFYRTKPIPMVYGYVPQSPLVMGKNKKLYADSKPIEGFFKNNNHNPGRYGYPFGGNHNIESGAIEDWGSIFVSIDDYFCNLTDYMYHFSLHTSSFIPELPSSPSDLKQVDYLQDDEYDTQIAKLASNPLLSRKLLQVFCVYKPGKITLQRRNDESTWEDEDVDYFYSLGDGEGDWGSDTNLDSHGNVTGGDQLTETEFTYMTDGDFSTNHVEASGDTIMAQRSEAMIEHADFTDQLRYNKYKHSLFRFIIDTEPPVSYISRGGISDTVSWIAFGHWVMPLQGNPGVGESGAGITNHNIYTCAEYNPGTNNSYSRIRNRNYTDTGSTGGRDYQFNTPNGFNPSFDDQTAINPITDSWGRQTFLGDIVRFSDYHDHSTYGDVNPTQINWHNIPGHNTLDKSPLELFGLETEDETETSDYNNEYLNPYAMFSSHAEVGEYKVQLGAYGWRSTILSTSSTTDNFREPAGDPSYNFEYIGRMKGWLPEVTCMNICDVKTNFQDLYGSVIGRLDSANNLITHPADIIADIFVNELGHSASKIDQETLNTCKSLSGHSAWKFAFTQKDEINSKDLIEDIAKSTFIFPRISFDGLLKFPSFKRDYSEADWSNAILISSEDIIKYSYDLTKREDLSSKIKLKFNYSYNTNSFLGDENTVPSTSDNQISAGLTYNTVYDIDVGTITDNQAEFYGITNIEDNIKEVESKYIRSSDNGLGLTYTSNAYQHTAKKFVEEFSVNYYKHRHLIIKCKLPLRYLNIEVGDYIKFDSLIDDVKAHGIDYAQFVSVNGQFKYPMFMCTLIKKTIEDIELECIQLPHLYDVVPDVDTFSFWYDITPETIGEEYSSSNIAHDPFIAGCTDITAENYNPDASVDDGNCTYSPDLIYGCTDPEAENYNPDATYEDGTCTYETYPEIPEDEPNATEVVIEVGLYTSKVIRFTLFDLLNTFPYSLPYTGGICYLLNLYPESFSGTYLINNMNDEDGGFNHLFPMSSFQADFGSGFVPINSWNELISPGNQNSNLSYVYISLRHQNNIPPPGQSHPLQHTYYYKLTNTQTQSGQPQDIKWTFNPPESYNEMSPQYSENGQIIATAHIDNPYGENTFRVHNYSDYPIKYIPPHPMWVLGAESGSEQEQEGSQFYTSNVLGDVNGDGIVDILDLVSMVNLIMTYEDTSLIIQAAPQVDINNDGILDILDVINLINIIVENE